MIRPGIENPPSTRITRTRLSFLLFLFYCTTTNPSIQPMQHDEHHRALLDAQDDGASSSSSSERATIPVTAATTVDYDKSDDPTNTATATTTTTTTTTTQPTTGNEEQQRLLDNDNDPERDHDHRSSWEMEVQEPNQPVYLSKWVNVLHTHTCKCNCNSPWMIGKPNVAISCGGCFFRHVFLVIQNDHAHCRTAPYPTSSTGSYLLQRHRVLWSNIDHDLLGWLSSRLLGSQHDAQHGQLW